jgi:hypothetical protein
VIDERHLDPILGPLRLEQYARDVNANPHLYTPAQRAAILAAHARMTAAPAVDTAKDTEK